MGSATVREYLTDAIRYWEPRRILFNLALAALFLFYFVRAFPLSKTVFSLDSVLLLILLAVLANVAYSTAYVVDIFAQASAFRERWRGLRWCLFVIGLIVAAILTRFWAFVVFEFR